MREELQFLDILLKGRGKLSDIIYIFLFLFNPYLWLMYYRLQFMLSKKYADIILNIF